MFESMVGSIELRRGLNQKIARRHGVAGKPLEGKELGREPGASRGGQYGPLLGPTIPFREFQLEGSRVADRNTRTFLRLLGRRRHEVLDYWVYALRSETEPYIVLIRSIDFSSS